MGSGQSSATIAPSKYHGLTEAEVVAKDFASECVNKHIIVTGANVGLGLETARVLALNGAEVILCSRNMKNGEDAVQKIKASNPTAKVSAMELDLASLKSINAFVDKVKALNKPVHILINNAGVMACPYNTTADGFELQIGTNHFGPFHLTRSLLPLLSQSGTKESPARVINLSSCANILWSPPKGIDFDDIAGTKHYHPFTRYGESKLAAILFTRELNKRAPPNVISVALHPGVIQATNLGRFINFSSLMGAIWMVAKNGHLGLAVKEPRKTIAHGSSTTVLAALDPNIKLDEYYANCNPCKDIHPAASNPELQVKLWEVSEKMVDEALAKLQ